MPNMINENALRLDSTFSKAFTEFRASAKTYSQRAVKVIRIAINRAMDNKSFDEWSYIIEQLNAKQVKGAPARKDLLSATANATLRKALRIGIALVAGAPVEGRNKPTFSVKEETLSAPISEIIDGRLRFWKARRNAFTDLDAIGVQIVKEAPDMDTLLKRFANAANAALAGGWTLQDLQDLLKEAETEAPKAAA